MSLEILISGLQFITVCLLGSCANRDKFYPEKPFREPMKLVPSFSLNCFPWIGVHLALWFLVREKSTDPHLCVCLFGYRHYDRAE